MIIGSVNVTLHDHLTKADHPFCSYMRNNWVYIKKNETQIVSACFENQSFAGGALTTSSHRYRCTLPVLLNHTGFALTAVLWNHTSGPVWGLYVDIEMDGTFTTGKKIARQVRVCRSPVIDIHLLSSTRF